MKQIHDVIIVGGGPAGYTAALYCTRAGMDTVLVEKLSAGGQMALTTQIDNYPGFEEGVDGFTLGEKMQAGAERFGAVTELAEVLSVELKETVKKVVTSEGELYGRSVILAMGAEPRELGLEGEASLVGRGIGYCAACDGMFYKGKTVAIVGGGNTAAADALMLSRICKKVILIHRRDTLRATKIYHDTLFHTENIEFCWNSEVTELIQEQKLTGIRVQDVNSKEERVLEVEGLFVSIGQKPTSHLVAEQVALDPSGYIIADETTRTNIPGVFAAGDVRTKPMRQVVTAVADGAVASHFVEEYLAELI